MDAARRHSSTLGSAWRDALRFDQTLLDEGPNDAHTLFDMIDGDPVQVEMVDDTALGTKAEACAVADQGALEFDMLANPGHGRC